MNLNNIDGKKDLFVKSFCGRKKWKTIIPATIPQILICTITKMCSETHSCLRLKASHSKPIPAESFNNRQLNSIYPMICLYEFEKACILLFFHLCFKEFHEMNTNDFK